MSCFYDSWKGGTVYFSIFGHHGHSTNIHYWSESGTLRMLASGSELGTLWTLATASEWEPFERSLAVVNWEPLERSLPLVNGNRLNDR